MNTHTVKPALNKFLPESVYGRTFLLITVLESGVDIILEAIVIARLNLIHSLTLPLGATATRAPLAVYLAIFILAHLFQLYFALDALRHKNTIQLIGLCCFNFAFLVYAVIQVPEIREIEAAKGIATNSTDSTPAIILLIIPACIGLSQLAFGYLTWHLFKEFGWQIYKQIGADRKIKRVYLWYQIFMCLLKFDYFFFIAFSVQLVLLVPSVSPLERVLTVIALPITLLLLVLGYYAVRNERSPVIFSFMVGLLSGSSYFVYKLFRIWQGRMDPNSYQNVFKSLTVFSVSCLLMTLLSFTSAIICWRNFGKGLKAQIDKNSSSRKHLPRRRRDPAGQVYGGGMQGMGVSEHGGSGRRGSGTSMNTMTKKGMEGGYGLEEQEPQKLATFKTNAGGFLHDDDPTLVTPAGYFATSLAFDARPSPRDPPPLYPAQADPPPPLSPVPLALPCPPPSAKPRTPFHPFPQRRQNSATDDAHKRMSID